MYRSLGRIALATGVLSVFALAAPSAAAQEVPFHLDGTFTFTVVRGNTVLVTGDGHTAPGGAFVFEDYVRVEYGGRAVEGTITLEFASGSTLTFDYEAPISVLDDGTRFVSGTYVVVGGTGYFEGASGNGIIEYPIGQGAPFLMDGVLIR